MGVVQSWKGLFFGRVGKEENVTENDPCFAIQDAGIESSVLGKGGANM